MSVCYKKLNFKKIFRYGQMCSPLGLAPPTQNSKKAIQLYTLSERILKNKVGGGVVRGEKEKKIAFNFICLSHRERPRLYKEQRQMCGNHNQLSISSEDLDRIRSSQRQSIPIFGIFLCIWKPVLWFPQTSRKIP